MLKQSLFTTFEFIPKSVSICIADLSSFITSRTIESLNSLMLLYERSQIKVNWCELIVTNLDDKQLHYLSFITDLKITGKNIEEIIEAGRTRWKIENENNNTLKNHGYDLAHNYGHGKEYLSQNICSLNILAFLFHAVQEFEDKNYMEVRTIVGTRREFFQTLNMLTTMFVFKSFIKMIEFVIIQRTNGKKVNHMVEYIVI